LKAGSKHIPSPPQQVSSTTSLRGNAVALPLPHKERLRPPLPLPTLLHGERAL
jgi:hypothetical protein